MVNTTLRSVPCGRGGRQFAAPDPIRPVGVELKGPRSADPIDLGRHGRTGPTGLNPGLPRVGGRVELGQVEHRHLARCLVAQLMAQLTTILHPIDPIGLCPHRRPNAVATWSGARKVTGRRHLEKRIPVVGRIDLGRFLRRRSHHSGQAQILARSCPCLLGVDQAVPTHPHLVRSLRQVRHQKTPRIVSHDDLPKGRLEVARLGDHPDTGLRAARAGHHTRDVVIRRRATGPPATVKPATTSAASPAILIARRFLVMMPPG